MSICSSSPDNCGGVGFTLIPLWKKVSPLHFGGVASFSEVIMLRLCKCGAAVKSPPCIKCCPKKSKGSYDHQWRKLSERTRAEKPLCEDCYAQGNAEPSVEVHHIVPIEVNPRLRLEPSNLASLCKSCHDKRHGKV